MEAKRVLMILTSAKEMGSSGRSTGFWFEELAAPYFELRRSGLTVDLASPGGGAAPADPASLDQRSEAVERFRADPEAMDKLQNTQRLDQLNGDYDAYFVVGGHGVMWDLAESQTVKKLLGNAYRRGAIIAAVCHGPAALVQVEDASGRPLVAGKRVAGFSNEEEVAAHLDAVVPFALETRLRELGGDYQRGPMWGAFMVRDERLITGQNPASSVPVALEVIRTLSESRS